MSYIHQIFYELFQMCLSNLWEQCVSSHLISNIRNGNRTNLKLRFGDKKRKYPGVHQQLLAIFFLLHLVLVLLKKLFHIILGWIWCNTSFYKHFSCPFLAFPMGTVSFFYQHQYNFFPCFSTLLDRSNYLPCLTESETCAHIVRPALTYQEIYWTTMPDTKKSCYIRIYIEKRADAL